MLKLAANYRNRDFVVVYVREAHLGESIPAHSTFEGKKACARRLIDVDNEPRATFIDDLSGKAHAILGGLPNAVCVIDDLGPIRFKSDRNSPAAAGKAIRAIPDGAPVSSKSYFKPAKPWIVHQTVSRAGLGSLEDFVKSLPTLVRKMADKKSIKTFFERK